MCSTAAITTLCACVSLFQSLLYYRLRANCAVSEVNIYIVSKNKRATGLS